MWIREEKETTLAYADDVVIITENEEQLSEDLSKLL